jgi:ribosomal protein S6
MSPAVAKTYLYEAMFLVDPTKARQGEKQTTDDLADAITRSGGQIVNLVKWADRELAYAIRKNHQKYTRAVYFLSHFNAGGDAVTQLERNCHNLDWMIRSIIVRDEDGPVIPGDMPAKPVEEPQNPRDEDASEDDSEEEGV